MRQLLGLDGHDLTGLPCPWCGRTPQPATSGLKAVRDGAVVGMVGWAAAGSLGGLYPTGSVVVTDELPDGMTFDKGFVPTLNVNWKDATGAIDKIEEELAELKEAMAAGDPRKPAMGRYASRDAYLAQARQAVDALVSGRYLLAQDADPVMQRMQAQWDATFGVH